MGQIRNQKKRKKNLNEEQCLLTVYQILEEYTFFRMENGEKIVEKATNTAR